MAPTALAEQRQHAAPDIDALKAALASNGTVDRSAPLKKVQRDGPERKPVADDYMYAFKYQSELPVLSKDVLPIEDGEAVQLAEEFVAGLEKAFADPKMFAGRFLDQGEYTILPSHQPRLELG